VVFPQEGSKPVPQQKDTIMNTETLQATMDAIDLDERWDNGELDRDEQFAKSVEQSPEQQAALDESLGLQMISIRLPKALIEDYKFIADANGLKYQTLMRQILARFAESEKKQMRNKAAIQQLKARRFG
jgi:predicted DNA binding CopG/RHH family protein